jgi:hypothetical protein
MIARVRVVTEVHYDYDVGEPDEEGNLFAMTGAAEQANSTILQQVKGSVVGTVIDDLCLVEEVRLDEVTT